MKKKKEHFQMRSVAPPTCERKQIIAEFMFLDSSKMEKPHAQPGGSGLFLRAEMRTGAHCINSFLFCSIVLNLWMENFK